MESRFQIDGESLSTMESRFQLEPTFFQFLYSIKDGHDTVPHAAERPARRNSTMISGVVVSARTKCPCTMHYDTCSFAYVSATMPSRHISRSGEAHAVWHDTLSLVLCLAGGSMRSSRPIRYSKVWPYVEDTKSRSKVSESEEDLANSGYASPSCFSLCWFAWKADCSASVRQYLWSGRRVAGFWLRQRQTGIHILFATLQIQPDMIEVRSFGSISYILGSVWVDVRELLLRPP